MQTLQNGVDMHMPHVEQELFSLPEHINPPPPSVFSGVRVARSLVFYVIPCPFLLVRLAIELPVLLRFVPLINLYLQIFLTEQYNRIILNILIVFVTK